MTEISGRKTFFETKSLNSKECNALRFNTFELDLVSEIESKFLLFLKYWKLSKDLLIFAQYWSKKTSHRMSELKFRKIWHVHLNFQTKVCVIWKFHGHIWKLQTKNFWNNLISNTLEISEWKQPGVSGRYDRNFGIRKSRQRWWAAQSVTTIVESRKFVLRFTVVLKSHSNL